MLDGVADFIVTIAVVGGGAAVVLRDHSGNWREFALCAAAIAFTGVFFLMKLALGYAAAVPCAALAATVILAIEAGFGVMLLGKLFERFDVSEEPTN